MNKKDVKETLEIILIAALSTGFVMSCRAKMNNYLSHSQTFTGKSYSAGVLHSELSQKDLSPSQDVKYTAGNGYEAKP